MDSLALDANSEHNSDYGIQSTREEAKDRATQP